MRAHELVRGGEDVVAVARGAVDERGGSGCRSSVPVHCSVPAPVVTVPVVELSGAAAKVASERLGDGEGGRHETAAPRSAISFVVSIGPGRAGLVVGACEAQL